MALRLAESGAEVIAVSRTESDLVELAALNPKIKPLCLDIGNWEKTKSALQDVGPIDLLVNNAAIVVPKVFGEMLEEDIDKLFNVNVKAIINITQLIASDMKARGQGGSIVNVSSIAGLRGTQRAGIYCASKGAVDQLTRSMAGEYGPHNIRVNSVNPTAIRTKMAAEVFENSHVENHFLQMTPLRRLGEVDDVAYPILFLLSDKASLISGVVLPIDGALTACF